MVRKTLIVAAVLALLAGCNKAPDPRAERAAPPNRADTSAASGSSANSTATPNTPANLGQPSSAAEKREGANPQQQQVDPKERAQHRDFQQSGDSKGPQGGPDTQPNPKSGS